MKARTTIWDLPVYHPVWICLLVATIGPVVTLFTYLNCNRFDADELFQILQITGSVVAAIVTFVVKWDKAHASSSRPDSVDG